MSNVQELLHSLTLTKNTSKYVPQEGGEQQAKVHCMNCKKQHLSVLEEDMLEIQLVYQINLNVSQLITDLNLTFHA